MVDTPALRELRASELDFDIVTYSRAESVEEGAAKQGIEPGALIKTLVIRRGAGDYLFVLVPGDREMDWAKLRGHLGVSRISMPDAAEAFEASGYERGTITPFGAKARWPVLADSAVTDRVSIGGGAHGVAIHVDGAELLEYLDAEIADITTA